MLDSMFSLCICPMSDSHSAGESEAGTLSSLPFDAVGTCHQLHAGHASMQLGEKVQELFAIIPFVYVHINFTHAEPSSCRDSL